jgi:hypothetical protein
VTLALRHVRNCRPQARPVAGGGAAPAAPSNLVATALSSTQIGLTWTDNQGAGPDAETGFELVRATDSGFTANVVTTTPAANATSATSGSLTPSTTYYYRIRAVNAAGNSAYSNTASATTDAAPPPGAVQVLPTQVGAARAKAVANTAQWQTFKAYLDSNLDRAIFATFQGDAMTWVGWYAMGYQCLKDSDPTTASRYADKAIGHMLQGVRGNQKGSNVGGGGVLLGRGTGSGGQVFTLPNADYVPATLVVWKVPVYHVPVVRGPANTEDEFALYLKVIKVSNTSDGAADYAEGADWRQGGPTNGLLSYHIDWSPGGAEPAPGATYYLTTVDVPGIYESALYHIGSDFTASGTTLTFSTAVPTDHAVVASYMYGTWTGGASTLGYQLTSDGLGGLYNCTIDGPSYSTRFLGYIGLGLDWLWDYPGLGSAIKTEIMAQLVQWFDWVAANGYNRASVDSNYSTGHFFMWMTTAAAFDGRELTNGPRFKAYVQNWYASYAAPHFLTQTGMGSTLEGGHVPEGWNYGPLAVQLFCGSAHMAEQLGWIDISDLRAWAADCIDALFVEQNTRTSIFTGGDGYSYPRAFPNFNILYLLAGTTTSSTRKAYANWAIQNYPQDQTNEVWDLLFRDPTAAATDFTAPGLLPLAKRMHGTGFVFFRKDYSYATTWISFHSGNLAACDHQEYGQGVFEVSRGADSLIPLIGGLTGTADFKNKSRFGGAVLLDDFGAGDMTYPSTSGGPAAGQWYTPPNGCRITKFESAAAYAYVEGDYGAAYGHAFDGVPNLAAELSRRLFFVRGPGATDYLFLHDRATTGRANDLKQFQFPVIPAATSSNTGGAVSVARGASKMWMNVYSDVPLTYTFNLVTIDNPNDAKMFTAGPTTRNAATVRYRSGYQVSPSSVVSPDAMADVPSTDGKSEGVRVGATVVIFGVTGAVVSPTSYTYTAPGGTLTHYVTDLTPSTSYTLSGAASGTPTSTAAGVITFTTTGSGSQTVTVT